MESKIAEMQKIIDEQTKTIAELSAWKQEFNSQKQSFVRLGSRLRKLCKKLTPTSEIVEEMQKLATEIKELVRLAAK